eukprot:scaffold647_cov411-Prasinococcus_capsulatus_cf.AAC.4
MPRRAWQRPTESDESQHRNYTPGARNHRSMADSIQTKMPMTRFGSSGMEVSRICLGTMTWGKQNSEAEVRGMRTWASEPSPSCVRFRAHEAHEQLDFAVEAGVNFIDTAEMYPVPVSGSYCGRTEEYIGTWLADRTASGKVDRSKIFIATKCSGPPQTFGEGIDRRWIVKNREWPLPEGVTPIDAVTDDTPQPTFDKENLVNACKASLARLQTSYIDLYQLHWPGRYCPAFGKERYQHAKKWHDNTEHVLEDMEVGVKAIGSLIEVRVPQALRAGTSPFKLDPSEILVTTSQAGLIRHWGLSNETAFGITMSCVIADKLGVPRPTSVQNDFSILDRRFEGETAEACDLLDVAGMPYGCLNGGMLSGKYFAEGMPAGPRSCHEKRVSLDVVSGVRSFRRRGDQGRAQQCPTCCLSKLSAEVPS